MGYHLNRPDEPVVMAGPKPMRTEFGIYHRLESCGKHYTKHKCAALKLSGKVSILKDHFRSRMFSKATDLNLL